MKFGVSDNMMTALSSIGNSVHWIQQKAKKQQLTLMDMYNRPMCGRSTGTYTNLGDLQRDLRGLSPAPPNTLMDM
jgi:hypothetical protein